MTKAELEAKVAELTAALAALMAQVGSTTEEEPAEVAAEPSPPTAEPESPYGPYNERWCRTYAPIKSLLDEYENDGNRFHEMLVRQQDHESLTKYGYKPREATYLIKPETGFTSKDHETFFQRAYNGNRNRAHYLPLGSNFFKGRVFTSFRKQIWELPFPWVVGLGVDFEYGEEVPFAGTGTQDVADRARVLFEKWWTRGGVLRWNWKNFLQHAQSIDRQYKDGASEEFLKKLHPWWRPDDGSPAVF